MVLDLAWDAFKIWFKLSIFQAFLKVLGFEF